MHRPKQVDLELSGWAREQALHWLLGQTTGVQEERTARVMAAYWLSVEAACLGDINGAVELLRSAMQLLQPVQLAPDIETVIAEIEADFNRTQ